MPDITAPNASNASNASNALNPLGTNEILRFGSEQHKRILEAILARVDIAERALAKRTQRYEQADEQYQGFVPSETSAKSVCAVEDANTEDDGSDYQDVFIPYSYSMVLAAHTYWSSVFFSRDPIFQFMGRHGEAEHQIQAVEALINYQTQVGEMLPALSLWMLGAARYGRGTIGTYWDQEVLTIAKRQKVPRRDIVGNIIPDAFDTVTEREQRFGYVGNRVYNVNVYDALPDPRVSVLDQQSGEFYGRFVDIGWNELVRGAAQGDYFNVEVVRRRKPRSARASNRSDYLPDTTETAETDSIMDVGFIGGIHIVVELIPNDWGLGTSKQPEKWVFVVAGREIIIQARPQGAYHDKFPFIDLMYEFDPHTVDPRGMLELLAPLNKTLTWLFNSHFYNVRAVLNNQVVVDPSRVHIPDLTRKGAGKLIRLKREAWGSDPRLAIHQLQMYDVTQTHLRDVRGVVEFMQGLSGVSDNIMGMMQTGGRKSATEIRSSNTFSVNRLKTVAEFWSSTGFGPLATLLLQTTQQYYDLSRIYRIAGDTIQGDVQRMVDPDSIAGFFDFVPVDGTLPIDRYAQANFWRELIANMSRMPQLMQAYNIPGIFEWVAQLGGLKNIKRFRVQAVPDQTLMAQAQAGNVVPLGSGGLPPDVNAAAASLQVPKQLSGMGGNT